MIKYADYEYYNGTYKGSLTEDLFNFYVQKASNEITANINREPEEITEEFKYACCEIVDLLNAKGGGNPSIQSESIDGVSVTYKTSLEADASYNSSLAKAIGLLPQEYTRFL